MQIPLEEEGKFWDCRSSRLLPSDGLALKLPCRRQSPGFGAGGWFGPGQSGLGRSWGASKDGCLAAVSSSFVSGQGGRGRFQKGLRFPACKAWRRRWLRTTPPSSPCGGSGAERVSAACGMSGSVVPGDFGGMRGAGGSAWRWWRLRLCGGGPGRSGRRTMAEAAGEMGRRVVWVDLEMTGLDIEKDQIIEMACLVTDSDLNILAEGPNLIINQPDELLDSMSEWCREQHGKSGLTKAVKESTISLRQAEYEFLSFVRQQTPPGLCPLAGNSVHADKKFLDKHMPQFMKHLHYRIIDVSTVKELCRRWYPEDYEIAPKKSASHRALEDIRESIKELQFYRDSIFKRKTEEKKRKLVENGEGKKSVS